MLVQKWRFKKKTNSFRCVKALVHYMRNSSLFYIDVQTEWNIVQGEMLPLLLPSYLASNATSSVVQELWLLNADLVMRTMVEMHAADPSTISRILDVSHELKVTIMKTMLCTR